ncbi:serine/threonine-protein kinase [Mycolicibacterium agri]|nr:serine/threonine-protein kinase [Mycolicibacterium agri]
MTGHDLLGGRYELRGVLGYGGMAEVRDGWDTRLNRAVAVKLLHPALRGQPDIRRRFADEARSAAALTHPNIVAVHDFGEHGGTPFIVMERLPGQSLADLIALGPMPPEHVRSMLIDVLRALEAAHAAGVLHRDIKPGNVLISAIGDSMKVADFGIAKTGGASHTMTGRVLGTMSYLTPERVAGAPASAADDLYAAGVMGYEALLGRRAFPQDNPIALARAIMDDPPPPLASLRPDVEPTLVAVIDRAMARVPHQRFGSAAEMRAALTGELIPPVAVAPLPSSPRPATRVLDEPLPPSMHHMAAPHYVAAPPPRHRLSGRTRKVLAGTAVLGAFAIAAAALAADPFSSAPTQTVNTSSTMPTPTSAAPPPPPPPPTPVVQPPEPKPDHKKPEHKKPDHKPGKPGKPGRGNGPKERGG